MISIIDLYPHGVYHTMMIKDIKRRALHRTKILQGQLKGIEKMIDNEDYCKGIIIQSLAVQKSLSSLNKLILENHLKTHIKDKLTSGEDEQETAAIKELLDLYELSNIRVNHN